ncbi:DUF3841 domain-containing protein [Paenibacillus sp. T2-29]|uniref:DUF3841 domain-containing protein n=1 Tax=Paenibacillus TaxID=44249 RepID=UPI0039BC44A8
MIFWSMQTAEAWEVAKKAGYLEGKVKYASYSEEYKWMMSQMKMRIHNYLGEYPVWLWVKKPDMRKTGHFRGGTKCVRLKLMLDKEAVLVSDFYRWHTVLNNSFCSDNETEDEAFYNGELEITKEKSWERIFELDRETDKEWSGSGECLQGVTGRIYLENVLSVESFVTRKSWLD